MTKDDDDEALRRRGRTRPRPHSSTSNAYKQNSLESTNRPLPRPSKMKMASLMAVVDDESKSTRVKLDDQHSEGWTIHNAPISISSLTSNTESPATSLFQKEMPTIIPTFSREGTHTNGERKRVTSGDAGPAVTRSMLDVYFPSCRNETNGSSGNRSLKRKRRSGRRDEVVADVDLLRFGIDSTKLVPQGLVDRVDVYMSRAVLVKVVGNHVNYWCSCSGFSSRFLQELITLLAAYYPCSYPTLLDEVLAGFLFRRPEFMDALLPAMIDKMTKASESVTTTKYPVADALARKCSSTSVRTKLQVVRHDLACRTLLRCLVERNGEMFSLSPWLAACAVESSDSVLQVLWRALLSFIDTKFDWQINDPNQQIMELLAEEGKLRVSRITCAFVKVIISDDALRNKLVNSQSKLISDCLERAFKYASTTWSSSLLAEWLERRRKQQSTNLVAEDLKNLVTFLARFTSKLSVKNPEWFVKHVLNFILSSYCHEAEQTIVLRVILYDHMSIVFGGVCAQMSTYNSLIDASNLTSTRALDNFDFVEGQSTIDTQRQFELLIGGLRAANDCTSALFVDIWIESWSGDRINIPWSCMFALVSLIVQETVDDQSELGQKIQSLTIHVCRSCFRQIKNHVANHKSRSEIAIRYSEALNLLIPSSCPAARSLLHEVLEALVDSGLEDSAIIFGKVVVSHLDNCEDADVGSIVKRCAVQKSFVENDRTLANASASTTIILTTIQTLASAKTSAGDLTRRVLSTGPVLRLLVRLLNFGRRRRRQEMILDVMNVVLSLNSSTRLSRNWLRQHVVHELVHCAYTGPPSSARRVFALLQNMHRFGDSIQALLWAVLEQCTKLDFRRKVMECIVQSSFLPNCYHERADTFAELIKTMMDNLHATLMCKVLNFVEQKLTSCYDGKTRINLFLLLLLQKLVACEIQCDVFLPVVQLAICPLAPSDQDRLCLIRLQMLKAFCNRLIATSHRPDMSTASSRNRCDDLSCVYTIGSEHFNLHTPTQKPEHYRRKGQGSKDTEEDRMK
ncbi:uncharacterized protein PHALS_12919 [Plasmopara halstedii]|uniref:Uncharacterized protein n=1 Tax=Plasmopara halstedii TaxID=4781 RepID=A0A0P1AMQ0_PLAHL|nr:uncharacterized protein PHALS_12919 [Plasmopara halstedii]CEG42663.1 hypothetical protein PHALS_12919 [Plasmopara halstedii]|eukprot:XP_024579032.1 hypothetical protein PHALS_12919 [Plasmopara halstedii]